MKLTLKIKLMPTDEQANLLLNTMKEANSVCNAISDVAWYKRIFNNFKLHHEIYHTYKAKFKISSQVLVRCIAKVADAYKLDKKVKREFRPLGSIGYDSRIMTYKANNIVSLWVIGGRVKIPFVCHNPKYTPYIKGEADLVFKKGKFYLFQTVDVPEEDIEDVEEFIGVDMGLLEIAALSNGKSFNSKKLNDYREKRQKVRSSLQRKGTKGSKKVLKRLSGRERTTSTIINHTISKQIVELAKSEGKGIAIEDLKGIRFSSNNKGKKFRTRVGKWNFNQLRSFLTYKSLLNGVKLTVVPPAYTSKTCSNCFHIGTRQGKKFTCKNCNSMFDADENAAKNIALLGMNVSHPEKPSILYCQVHMFLGLKPNPSLCVGG
ncbi:MAG: transposase [Chitinophagaceae bacterium]|nr:transposase [Chitinophagaceae bacterium]